MFYITISNGLLTPEHKERMGIAVWEFMWCIDKVTKIDDEGKGWVLGGKPIKLRDIGMSSDNRISLHIEQLREQGYIETTRTPYGMIIRVLNTKKRFTKTSDSPKPVIHRKRKRDSSFSRGDSSKAVDTKKTLQGQGKDIIGANAQDMKSYNENQHSDDGLPDLDLETGEVLPIPGKKLKTSAEMRDVFAVFIDNMARTEWTKHAVQRDAAQKLFDTYGLDEIRKRYSTILKYRDDPMCPAIYTPSSMLQKMINMEAYLKKL